jgi:ADP-heptose:LPS heptosyltransferase
MHGCTENGKRADRKTLPIETRTAMISNVLAIGATPILLGSRCDCARFWDEVPLVGRAYDMTDMPIEYEVAALQTCSLFLANDTGLVHVAHALNLRGLVMWKDTNYARFRSGSPRIKNCISPRGDPSIYATAIRDTVGKG